MPALIDLTGRVEFGNHLRCRVPVCKACKPVRIRVCRTPGCLTVPGRKASECSACERRRLRNGVDAEGRPIYRGPDGTQVGLKRWQAEQRAARAAAAAARNTHTHTHTQAEGGGMSRFDRRRAAAPIWLGGGSGPRPRRGARS